MSPFGLYYEGAGFGAAWKAATGVGGVSAFWLIRQMILDAFYYHAHNEVAFITFDRVSPITTRSPTRSSACASSSPPSSSSATS